MKAAHHDSVFLHPALLFALIYAAIFLLHLSLLRLPYFWDEAGYYIPAARDLFLTGTLIPHSAPSNAHPPLVMAYLAAWWELAGFAPLVTRTAMLAVAAFTLLGIFRIAQRFANLEVAIAATACTAIYPVFFTQSSLAHVDLAAAGLTFWGLLAYLEDRHAAMVVWFSLAVMAKETAVLAPGALLVWEIAGPWLAGRYSTAHQTFGAHGWRRLLFMIPLAVLGAWYTYHYRRTGYVFGNPEFFRYNVQSTLSPVRILLALGMRLWQLTGYLDLYVLTLATLIALWLPPLQEKDGERPRIPPAIQLVFLVIIAAYAVAMAVVGGAELARYMLPAIPLVIIVCVSTLRRRVPLWRWVVAIVVAGFLAGLLVNPPYGFSLEDNLAYRDYIVMHENAERFLEARYPAAHVLTAWPASDEITRPYLGYVTRPMRVVRIEDFSPEQMMSAADIRDTVDVALVFSTKYQPPHPLLERWRAWDEIRTRYFGYHQDVPIPIAARILGGQTVYSESRNGQWIGIVELQRVQEAKNSSPNPRRNLYLSAAMR